MLESKAEDIVLQSLLNGLPSGNTNEAYQALRALQYYQSIEFQRQDLIQKYLTQFENSATWDKIPKVCYNLVRPITKTMSRLYSYPVVRQWQDPKGKAADIFSKIIGYDRTMKTVDKYTLLTGTVGVRPIWDENLKKLNYAIYTRDMIDVTADAIDPSLATQVRLKWQDRGQIFEHIWDNEWFIEKVGKEVTEKKPNPYGKIPIVFFTNEEQTWGVIEGPARDLVEANLTLNWLMTSMNDTGILQTAGLLVTKGADANTKIKAGQRSYISLPDTPDADAKYINSNADIDKFISIVNLNLSMFLSSRNIPESAIRATQDVSKSGVSMVYEQAAIIDYVNDRKVQFRDKDAQLAQLSVEVVMAHSGQKGQTVEAPSIKYKEFTVPMGADERDAWQFKIDKNLATPIDMMMAEDPALDEEAAKERLEKNKRLNASLGIMGAQADQLKLNVTDEQGGASKDQAQPEPDQVAALEDAQAKLKGTVGGVTAILAIQASVAAGTTGYESAVTVLSEIYGFDPALSRRILGKPKPIKPATPNAV